MIPPIARRFVAGDTQAEAIDHAIAVAEDDLGVIINLLGEHFTDRDTIRSDVEAYCQLLDDLADLHIDACISVKPTQIGLDLGTDVFRENLATIVERARSRDGFVWIDMEDSDTTEATVAAFETMAHRYPGGVGVCVQSNLKRTAADIERTASVPGKIRLVKGAYREPASIAYQSADRVNEAYREDLESLFRLRDDGVAIGSHDPAMIEYGAQLHDVHGTPFEYQFLMGVRPELERELARDYTVYQYVPYGPRWLSYFTRRVLERTDNARFALRALLPG